MTYRRPVVRRHDPFSDWVKVFIYVLSIIVVLWLGVWLHQAKVDNCEARGGHWIDVSRSGICVDSDGRIMPWS